MVNIVMPSNDPYGHCGDTFRELVRLWQDYDLCNIEYKETTNVWFGDIGNIILYDRPRLDWFDYTQNFKDVLWGNTVPPKGIPWIFWGRRPSLMHQKFDTNKAYSERTVQSFFAGKVENDVQMANRCSANWDAYIDVFEMPVNGHYIFSQDEYLDLLKDAKYGLCLPGFGPKCNREIELLCMGTVPIFTPGVDTQYHDPLYEDVHYIFVESPEDIPGKITSISEDHWTFMNQSGRQWYERNASVHGSFNRTIEILYKNKLI